MKKLAPSRSGAPAKNSSRPIAEPNVRRAVQSVKRPGRKVIADFGKAIRQFVKHRVQQPVAAGAKPI